MKAELSQKVKLKCLDVVSTYLRGYKFKGNRIYIGIVSCISIEDNSVVSIDVYDEYSKKYIIHLEELNKWKVTPADH